MQLYQPVQEKIYNVHTYISWVECLSSLVSIM